METDILNKAYRDSMNQYNADRERIHLITCLNNSSGNVKKKDIEWLCAQLLARISQLESSWYDHG